MSDRPAPALAPLIARHDWAATPIGPPEAWPPMLRATLRLALATRHPAVILWGAELTCLYNDAYRPALGPDRHPWALGRPAREVWDGIWHIIGPQIEQVMSGGGATWHEDHHIPLPRNGRIEDSWWTYSYSPIEEASAPGGIGGVLVLCSDVTAAHRAREALREGEARFRLAADSSPALMWMTDAEGEVVFANARYRDFFGVGAEEMLGAGWRRIVHPDDVDAFHDAFRTAFARREPFSRVVRVLHPALGTHWLSCDGSPRHDADGAFLGYAGINIDVTAVHRAEAALRESEGRFRALTTLVPNFIWFATPDGQVHYLNDRWYQYTGQTPEQAVPDGWASTLHPEDAARTAAIWADARAREITYEVEVRYRRRDGAHRWYLARAEPVRDEAGRVTAWFGSSTDIHDRMAAEATLGESEARFRNMADNAPVMIWTTDEAGNCTYLNRLWYDFTGMSEEEGLGVGWLEAVHPDDRPRAGAVFLDATAHQVPFRLDYRLRRADGGWAWAIDAAAPRFGERGEFLGFIGSVIDITERKLAEERQVLLMRELDHRAKNALAVVQATLRLTPKNDASAYASAVEGRVRALARAHSMLAEARWEGAELRGLLEGELAPFLLGQRVELSGPAVSLPAASAQSLAMAAHELATNAVKHGALSAPGGRLSVAWSVARGEGGDRLLLRWAEVGGPAVAGPPGRRGFGSRMLDATMRTQLGGSVSLAWLPGGLVCDIEIPLRRPAETAPAPGAALAVAEG